MKMAYPSRCPGSAITTVMRTATWPMRTSRAGLRAPSLLVKLCERLKPAHGQWSPRDFGPRAGKKRVTRLKPATATAIDRAEWVCRLRSSPPWQVLPGSSSLSLERSAIVGADAGVI